MTNEDYDRKKLAYEKALEIRYRQVELGYQMFNFFMVGMSFMVLAFATIVASDSASGLHGASRGIALLGIVLSVIFAIVGFFATETVTKYDGYLSDTERVHTKGGSDLDSAPFERILRDAADLPKTILRDVREHRFIPTVKRWAARLLRFRLAMAWCIPTVFIAFWVSMCAMFWNY